MAKQKSAMTSSTASGKYECPACQDQEIVILREPVFEEDGITQKRWPSGLLMFREWGEDCKCKPYKVGKRRLEQSGLAEVFGKISFDSYRTEGMHILFTEAKSKAMKYAEQFQERRTEHGMRYFPDVDENSMALFGEPGAGKTLLVQAVGNSLLQRRIPVLYFQHREEFDNLKDTKFAGAEELFDRMKHFPGLLIWDDMLKTTKKDERTGAKLPPPAFETDATWSVLNYRYQKKLPCAISTEWKPAELANLDRSMAGRIIERAKPYMVTFRLSKEEQEQGLNPIEIFDQRFNA